MLPLSQKYAMLLEFLRTRVEEGTGSARALTQLRLAKLVGTDQPGEALLHIAGALGELRAQKDWLRCADALVVAADTLDAMGEADGAKASLDEAAEIYCSHQDGVGLAIIAMVQGHILLNAGDLIGATKHLQLALKGVLAARNVGLSAHLYATLARVHIALDQVPVAVVALASQASCLELGGRRLEASRVRAQRGALLAQQGNLEGAAEEYAKAAEAATDDPHLAAAIAADEASLLIAMGRAPKAIRRLRSILAAKQALPPSIEGQLLFKLGLALSSGKTDMDELELVLGRAFEIFRDGRDEELALRAARLIVQAAERTGELHRAAEWMIRAAQAPTTTPNEPGEPT
jgi:tetratricopeptide (TPR) repeat protein